MAYSVTYSRQDVVNASDLRDYNRGMDRNHRRLWALLFLVGGPLLLIWPAFGGGGVYGPLILIVVARVIFWPILLDLNDEFWLPSGHTFRIAFSDRGIAVTEADGSVAVTEWSGITNVLDDVDGILLLFDRHVAPSRNMSRRRHLFTGLFGFACVWLPARVFHSPSDQDELRDYLRSQVRDYDSRGPASSAGFWFFWCVIALSIGATYWLQKSLPGVVCWRQHRGDEIRQQACFRGHGAAQ